MKVVFGDRTNSELCSLFLIVLLAFFIAACSSSKSVVVHEFSGQIMGTYFRIKMLGDNENELKKLDVALMDSMERVNQSMSNYIETSEISRFNRLSATQQMKLSPQFAQVMRESIELSKMSNGAFDVTISPLINAWGFGEKGSIDRQPSATELRKLGNLIGYQQLSLEQDKLSKLVDGLEVNVSAIAKGYAVDQVAERLLAAGVENFLVDIGGEIRASGLNAQSKAWQIAIEEPSIAGGIHQIVELKDKAIATSGDYRNFLLVDGEQFSHTIDPTSLKPSLHRLASVSVLADRCSRADALATAIMVMGEERGFAFAEKHNLAVYMLIRSGQPNEYSILMTQKFRMILQ